MEPKACDLLMTRSLPKCHLNESAAEAMYVSVRTGQKTMFNLNETCVCMDGLPVRRADGLLSAEVALLHLPMATLAATSITSPR